MKTAPIDIVNKLGMHARAASKLVNLTKTFASRIELTNPAGETADAKRIMAVMMLEAVCGTTLELTCDGDDEEEAFAAICSLVADRFGERE
ncbi:MAG: HPr family phosphocarrier protein [Gammaproteobacteria bacterium]|nr:HPr family phosphocarrier protein [Gammaproteobacteria bacterium]MYA18232.1 HPr family phosphocarrier protein [Gammaproteobacteria bacterium]MYJ75634.1 HPr family phosphocarrier protein [Gammaproteobacteria bacterium]